MPSILSFSSADNCTEHMVLVTSAYRVTMTAWRNYVLCHWEQLAGACKGVPRLLVLTGVHGGRDKHLGARDQGLFRDCLGQVPIIRREKGHDVKVEVVNVGEHFLNEDIIDTKSLARSILNRNATVIVLAFCFTWRSELIGILERERVVPRGFGTSLYCKAKPVPPGTGVAKWRSTCLISCLVLIVLFLFLWPMVVY